MSDADKQCCPSNLGNLYLHRSELHAQRELDQHDPKAKRESASARAKGRKEGFAASAQKGISFKPLGVLREREELDDLNKCEVARVDFSIDKVRESMHSHQESKVKRAPGHADRGANDGDKDNDGEDHEDKGSRDQAAQKQKRHDHSLDLRAGRRAGTDGFDLLRASVRESELRLQAVKTDGSSFELHDGASELERLMPPRYLYPAVQTEKRRANTEDGALKSARGPSKGAVGKRSSSSAMTSTQQALQVVPPVGPSSGSRSARGPAPAPPERLALNAYAGAARSDARRSPRMLPIQLPSLAEFIAASGPAMGDRGGPARGDKHVREAVNELLGLQPHATLKLTQEDLAGGKRRNNVTKRLGKQLDLAWADRGYWKRVNEAGAGRGDSVGMGDDPKADRHAKADSVGAVVKESETPHPPTAEEGGGAAASGSRKKRNVVAARQAEEAIQAEEASLYEKVEQLMSEPDVTISPVERLRSALVAYQETRVRYRGYLESTLVSLEANRIESLKRRAAHCQPGPGDAKAACDLMRIEAETDMLRQHLQDRMKQQYLWYRSLWSYVQSDKREMKENNVAHFIFDFVKMVLEHGKVFSSDMYFAMLDQIENFEFSTVIASLVVNMICEIENVETEDILDWFIENRGTVPPHVEEVISQRKRCDDEVPPPPAASEQPAVDGRAVTFVTEATV